MNSIRLTDAADFCSRSWRIRAFLLDFYSSLSIASLASVARRSRLLR